MFQNHGNGVNLHHAATAGGSSASSAETAHSGAGDDSEEESGSVLSSVAQESLADALDVLAFRGRHSLPDSDGGEDDQDSEDSDYSLEYAFAQKKGPYTVDCEVTTRRGAGAGRDGNTVTSVLIDLCGEGSYCPLSGNELGFLQMKKRQLAKFLPANVQYVSARRVTFLEKSALERQEYLAQLVLAAQR